MLSYTFYAFNFPLIRFFEGYKFQEDLLLNWFSEWLKTKEKERFKNVKIKKQFRQLDRDFPSGEIMPTKIGNTIAAFEEYPKNRYGMDTIALWPRLVPVLKGEKFLDYVIREKSVFDFLLNTCIVVIALGLELVYRALFLGDLVGAIFILGVICLMVIVLYEGMYIAARQWGTVVRVAFDLHRHDLAQRLALKPATTFREEWARWEAISRFFLHRRHTYRSFEEFIPQSETHQFKKTTKHFNKLD
jgi:hypothetical protein